MEENIEDEPVAKKQKIENSKDAVIIDDEARLSELLYRTLKDVFGFDSFREGQYAVIRSLMRGNNTVAIFPTGSGKSLCYQLPACLLGLFGVTVVVSPLLALMKDQMDAMRAKGIAADMIGSSLSFEERRATRERLQNGQTNVLLVAPEQLNNESSKALILSLKISLLVIDEVHCISEWGHSFRPDYLRLASFAQACGCSRVLGLTATATPAVVQDVCRAFQVSPENCIQTPFHRKNLRLCFHAVSSGSRHDKLLDLLRVPLSDAGPSIVYVTRQETAVTVAAALTACGHTAKPYHAGLSTELREEAQQWFMSCDGSIIVATIAFGMGIDKANVRRVIHYNLPKSLEGYAQEVGRAGRDGLPSHCDLLYCPDDLSDLEGFARCGTPTVRAIRSALNEVFLNSEDGNRPFPAGTIREFNVRQLGNSHDLAENAAKMLLAFVDVYHGHIEELTPKYGTYQLKWKEPDGRYCGAIAAFLRSKLPGPTGEVLSRLCVPKSLWTHLNMDEVVSQLSPLLHLSPSATRSRVLTDINSLENELVISASNVLNCFRILSVPADIEALTVSESERFLRREQQDMKRLEQVLQLISSKTCHSRVLMDHFGGPQLNTLSQSDRFHCSCQWCCESTPKSNIITAGVLSSRNSRPMDEVLVDRLRYAVSTGSLPSDDCLLLTRVCLGFTSPRITKLKLKSHPVYHSMAGCGYDEVYALCVHLCGR